jgi:hypothetical protein
MRGERHDRAPDRDAVLDTVTRRVTELSQSNAVDAATGDVIDHLVDTWLAQWREQLVRDHHDRQSALGKRVAKARNRLAAAESRAAAASAARAEATGTARNGSAAPLPPAEQTTPKQVTNGVRTTAPR